MFVLAFSIGVTVTAPSLAGVVVRETISYYPVKGVTGREIVRSFASNKRSKESRLLFGSKHAIASADFKVEVANIRKYKKNNYCRISDADVIVNVNYTYPKWQDKTRASASLKQEWSRFYDYVVWHEEQHVRIAKEFAGEYLALLRKTKFPILANCSSLPKSVNRKRTQLYKKQLKKQKRFDLKEGRSGGLGKKHLTSLTRAK